MSGTSDPVPGARRAVYLDYAATSPVDPRVVEAMNECLTLAGAFGNPSSAHAFGRQARARVEQARERIAALVGASPAEIVLTSGATESNNLALFGAARANADRGRHIVTSRTEHRAVLDPCRRLEKEGFSVTYLAPDASGRVDPGAVQAALRPDTVLVSIMHVNNETGVVQDIAAIGALCRERDIVFHSDAAQSAGRIPIDCRKLPVDLLSFTAHKLCGPKGIGALYVRRECRARLQPVSFGGGQEAGLRPGTLATHQIVGFGLACELARESLATETARLEALCERLWRGLEPLGGVHLNGAASPRVPAILNVSFEGVEGESLLAAIEGVAVSRGSACNSASGEPSYVLRALGRSSQLAGSSLRFGLGRFTTQEDIDFAVERVRAAVRRLRAVASGDPVDASADPGEAPAAELYGPLVRRLFQELPGAGRVTGSGGRLVEGEAHDALQDVSVRFQLEVEASTVKDARFQARGCPHTLAACAWLTSQLPGRRREELVPGAPEEWARTLEVPVEKLGRLLVVEDALRAAAERWLERA